MFSSVRHITKNKIIFMRILHIIDTLTTGGTSIFLYNLIAEWQKLRPEDEHCVIYAKDGATLNLFDRIGITPIRIRSIIPRYHIDHLPQLLWHATRYKPDIIHTILPNSCYSGALLGSVLRTPVIWGLHGDIQRAGRYHLLMLWLTRHLITNAVSVSRFVRDKLVGSCLKQKSVVINNGIDFTPFQNMVHKKRGLTFHIGTVARLDQEKTHHVLINAFALLVKRMPEQSLQLTLVGKGSERANLEALVADHNIEKQVTFAGYHTSSHHFYQTFDCFVLPSETEGLALALLEAMAAGCPVVCTHPNNEHDAIINGENGFIVPLHDSKKLADALQYLIENPDVARNMSMLNRERGQYVFSRKAMTQQYIDLFTSAVDQK